MRLPKKDLGRNIAQTSQMVDRYPRESDTLATKLFASSVSTEKAAKQEFETVADNRCRFF